MLEKYTKGIRSVIIIAATIIGAAAGVASALSSKDTMLNKISMIVMWICIAVVIVMSVIYGVIFFETRINGKNLTDLTMEMVKQTEKFKDATNDMVEKTSVLKQSIENFERDYQERFCPVRTSSYADNSEEVNTALFKLLKEREKEISELHIICFGRQGFGGAVNYIIAKQIDIKVKIIVFNPKKHADICRDTDASRIRENIKTWLRDSDKIEVIVSEIPPMIRAAIAYTKDKDGVSRAIWGSVQSYRFALDPAKKTISLEKPNNSLISVCEDNKTVTGDLYTLVNCFEEEFKRLEAYSERAELITRNGTIEVKLSEKIL